MTYLAAVLALTLGVHASAAVVAAPAADFELALNGLRADALAAASAQAKAADLAKVDKNVRIVDARAYRAKWDLSSLRAQARARHNDPALLGPLQNLIWSLEALADDCATVKKQVEALEASATKDPALAAAAKKLYEHARTLDSDAGWLAREARDGALDLQLGGYGAQAYRIQRLAYAAADLTPGVRESAKRLLDKIAPPAVR